MSLHFGREFKITELLKQERTAEVCQTLSKPAPPHFLYKGSREAAETGGGSLTEQSDEQIIVQNTLAEQIYEDELLSPGD